MQTTLATSLLGTVFPASTVYATLTTAQAMDPFTVLGTASSIITLLEFTWKLFGDTKMIYKSATSESEDNAVLSTIAEDVARLGDAVILLLECGDSLRVLINDAQGIARDLCGALNRLKVQGTKTVWKSFVVALKDVWGRRDIETFSHRLAKLQQQIASHIQTQILTGVSEISRAMIRMEHMNTVLGTTMEIHFRELHKDLGDAAARLDPEDSSFHNTLKKGLKIKNDTESLDERFISATASDLRDLGDKVWHLHDVGKTTSDVQRILQSLYFTGIRTRQRKILDAHARTFTWIFTEHLPHSDQRIKFVDWLQSSSATYWLQGKPGSGKSTLMKFVSNRDETQKYLKQWAGDKSLLVADFFFWHAGTTLQKSQTGLFRSLLFEVLRLRPALVPRVYEICATDFKVCFDSDWSWTCYELLLVCRKILEDCTDTKFCFFIDGLDEYEEDEMEPSDLIQSIKELGSLPNIKLCVSSRPWSVFADAFGQDPKLSFRLEELTKNDIKRFIVDKFNQNQHFVDIQNENPIATSSLIQDICQRARGVFLWVYLVVRNLLQGFTNGDTLKFLRARLELFPEDLEEFFRHMIDGVPSIYLQNTAQMFEIVKMAPEPQSAIAFSFIDEIETEANFAIQLPAGPMTEIEIQKREKQMRRQLDARSKGLLEITSDGGQSHPYFQIRIDFLHRTVREFLLRPDGLSMFLNGHLGNRNVPLLMCSAMLATLKKSPTQSPDNQPETEQLCRCLLGWAAKAEQSPETSVKLGLVEVLECAESLWKIQRPSFLGLACEQNILSYVLPRLGDSRVLAHINEPDRPLLDYALTGDGLEPHPTLIRGLLDNGADPNQVYDRSTVWAHFTSRIDRIDHHSSVSKDTKIKDVITLLVTYGANIHYQCQSREQNEGSLMRQNCLYGEAAWASYKDSRYSKPTSQIIRKWFTDDEFIAMLKKRNSADPRGAIFMRTLGLKR